MCAAFSFLSPSYLLLFCVFEACCAVKRLFGCTGWGVSIFHFLKIIKPVPGIYYICSRNVCVYTSRYNIVVVQSTPDNVHLQPETRPVFGTKLLGISTNREGTGGCLKGEQ